ncbi:putative transcriptional regulator of N-Acetylglucosamine utilization, GntR family [Candidatus Rhodobacter oscarellae]|uniref:Putative transcriptional regulator of N-Acetylglucosamine utilization, GntR family n=1 Tax=Candidatus Rhodobacter oscarellae TaxID=1675527 RepID=A0A0J9E171_9RHOB|nr:GntR family transcriptional regulator [Candidatus Rhodobacter lobularis]KMW56485.1 putative transcriptional regulator of N-Acetylglucosamine utilization, GntR family [Candidatus Rhodobacter lobularis]
MVQTHALPLYVQISEMLIRDIQSGRLGDGERLPPEREMAKDLSISVGTLRKSLADLSEKGLLERRQGSGNYVRHGAAPSSVYAFFRLERIEGGGLPTAQILSVELREKPDCLPAFGDGPMAHRIRRLRHLGGAPAAVEEIWLDASACAALNAEDLSESLYLFYKNSLNIWIQRAEDRVGVGDAPNWARAHGFDGTMGLVDRVSWSQTGASVEASRTWFDPNTVRYVARLT